MNGPNPRSIDDALQWQLERVGSTAWEGWSWKFQRLAHGYLHDDQWSTAEDALSWFDSFALLRSDQAPRGALVWYRPGRTAVVGCCLGSGRVVGPSLPDLVGVVGADDLPVPMGWTDPAFPFAR